MKIQSTVMLILTLVVMMLAAGSTSAFISYIMGQEALKVVTQPEVNTEKKLKTKTLTGAYKGLELVDEKKILVEVYNLTHAQEGATSLKEQSKFQKSNNLVNSSFTQEDFQLDRTAFPIKNSSQGVTLELVNAQTKSGSLLLNLNLKNEGTEVVRFLYSFMDVRDQLGRVISAIPEGLPGELPANGQNFSGQLKIPLALLDDRTTNISLTLTDYPDHQIELKLMEIPVSR